MLEKVKGPVFLSEADMCQQFLDVVPEGWTAYPETGGFDILLVRIEDGAQVGVEAKLKLNAKVISQASEKWSVWSVAQQAPDFRAVLVPDYVGCDLAAICALIGIQVIKITHRDDWRAERYKKPAAAKLYPDLPSLKYNHKEMCGEQWFDFCPVQRLWVPDYVPDTGAGKPSPVQLSAWKIKAIKIAVLLDKKGYVTREDFKKHGISMSRWTQGGRLAWLQPGEVRGQWLRTDRVPDFRAQHPTNYIQIEKSYEDWTK